MDMHLARINEIKSDIDLIDSYGLPIVLEVIGDIGDLNFDLMQARLEIHYVAGEMRMVPLRPYPIQKEIMELLNSLVGSRENTNMSVRFYVNNFKQLMLQIESSLNKAVESMEKDANEQALKAIGFVVNEWMFHYIRQGEVALDVETNEVMYEALNCIERCAKMASENNVLDHSLAMQLTFCRDRLQGESYENSYERRSSESDLPMF